MTSAPLVFAIIQTIANIIGSIVKGDLSGDRTGIIVFISSSIIGFSLVNVISYLISSKKEFLYYWTNCQYFNLDWLNDFGKL